MSEWLGDGLLPVEQDQADSRAGVCADCPKNGKVHWSDWIKAGVAKTVGLMVAAKAHADLTTPVDHRLGECGVCLCYLRLKVWVPLKHLKSTIDQEDLPEYPDFCWLKRELNESDTSIQEGQPGS